MTPVQRKLLGESVREIGVLAIVFVPLDVLVGPLVTKVTYPQWWLAWLNWIPREYWIAIFFAVAGVSLVYFGIKIESGAIKEQDEEDYVLDSSF